MRPSIVVLVVLLATIFASALPAVANYCNSDHRSPLWDNRSGSCLNGRNYCDSNVRRPNEGVIVLKVGSVIVVIPLEQRGHRNWRRR